MAKSHSRHIQHAPPEKPAPPAPVVEPAPAAPVGQPSWGALGYRIALTVWLAAFFALLAWMIFDLLVGLFS